MLKTGAVKKTRVQENDEVGGTRLASSERVVTAVTICYISRYTSDGILKMMCGVSVMSLLV